MWRPKNETYPLKIRPRNRFVPTDGRRSALSGRGPPVDQPRTGGVWRKAKFGALGVFLAESRHQGRIRARAPKARKSSPGNPRVAKARGRRMRSRCEKLRRPDGNGGGGRRDDPGGRGRPVRPPAAGMGPWYARPRPGSRSQGHPP